MRLQALSGMRDYIGSAAEDLEDIENQARLIFTAAGCRRLQTPVLEDAALFDRSLGSASDVVSKEMYTVTQGEDRLIALRPENTAGVVRALNEHNLMANRNQLKLFYCGPMFRHEKPQGGRLRQFHQVGVEVFGRQDPLCDAEVLVAADAFLKACSIENTKLLLNSIGCPECRPAYLKKLVDTVDPFAADLCEDCHHRLQNNPLRILDCKNESCRELLDNRVPLLPDHLCEDCDEHYAAVKNYLDIMAVNYEETPLLVRGLDYYTRTTFEFVSGDLGSQDAVLAGGRYDGLVEQLGGDKTPAIGFSAGMERMMILRGTYNQSDVEIKTDCYFIPLSDACLEDLLPLVKKYRQMKHPLGKRNLSLEIGRPGKSIKSQLRRANRYDSRLALIYGDNEREDGKIAVKDMISGDQQEVDFPPQEKILEILAQPEE